VPSLNDRIAARLKGVLDCLDDRRIRRSARHVFEVAAQTIVEGRGAMRALVAAHPNLTAIYCTTDTLAIGVLCECRTLGIRVPEDISVAGYSDLEIVSQLDPALSTVHIPVDQIGTCTADFLIDYIKGRTGPKAIELEAEVIIRRSTGPVRLAARLDRRHRAL
jgi:LacI family transcriptional regulator